MYSIKWFLQNGSNIVFVWYTPWVQGPNGLLCRVCFVLFCLLLLFCLFKEKTFLYQIHLSCVPRWRPNLGHRLSTLWVNPDWTLIHFWADQNWTRGNWTLLTSVFWYLFTPFHTHFIQFRYDFLSSINHYLIHFWVYQNVFDTIECINSVHQKWIKTRCPIFWWLKSVAKFRVGMGE